MSSLLDWLTENEPLFRRTRLPSLYSDLGVQRNTNPEGYSANITAWQAALTQASLAGKLTDDGRVVLQTSDSLLDALASPRYGRPSGLGLVIDESVRSKKMIDLNDFLSTETSIYHQSWIPSPWSIIRWSLQQTGLMGSKSYDLSGRLRSGSLVMVQALEKMSNSILAAQERKGQNPADRISSREDFVQDLAKFGLTTRSEQDIKVILRYLSRDKQVLTYDSQVVKFKAHVAVTLEPITSEDRTIASLKDLISNLSIQVTSLEQRITATQIAAQSAIKAGNKQSALSALRSKKLAEKNLKHRSNTLHQLEQTFAKIEQAADQVQIVQAMEASAGILRTLNRKVGGVEKVEDVVDQLKEQMGQVDEVGQVLHEPLDSRVILDEADVDEELEEMEREEKHKEDEREANIMRKRLEELDSLKSGTELGREQEESGQSGLSELSKSTQQLQRMSIEESRPTKVRKEELVEEPS